MPIPPALHGPTGDTLTQNTNPTHKHGGKDTLNPKRT
jgi:hypothetical protein